MLGSFLVMLRAGFEATPLVAVVLAYRSRMGWDKEVRFVWYGAGAEVPLSLATAGNHNPGIPMQPGSYSHHTGECNIGMQDDFYI